MLEVWSFAEVGGQHAFCSIVYLVFNMAFVMLKVWQSTLFHFLVSCYFFAYYPVVLSADNYPANYFLFVCLSWSFLRITYTVFKDVGPTKHVKL